MQQLDNRIIFSPTDLFKHVECPHRTILTLTDMESPLAKDPPDEESEIIKNKGMLHEEAYLERLKSQGMAVRDLRGIKGSHEEKLTATLNAMQSGVQYIYQAFLTDSVFQGYADFLVRVNCQSNLGDYSYEALDTKLAHHTKPHFVVQLSLYSELLGKLQGMTPTRMHIALGNGKEESYFVKDFFHYYSQLKESFLDQVQKRSTTYPDPCSLCPQCEFRSLCEKKRIEDDHLSAVANIRKSQIRRLSGNDITTLEKLAQSEVTHIKGIGDQTLNRLIRQASLQLHKRNSGKNKYEFLEVEGANKGLASLPEPNEGDLFFDIEGDPLYPEGLEYLFGVYYLEGVQSRFVDLWSHDHAQEKSAFEKLIRFFIERFAQFPNMHIYHYASYEETATKRLMCKYATMEAEVDHLLRHKVFVDLYRIVRQSLLISEPSYSIKNVEHFYMRGREADVKSASASIVYYEKYLDTGEKKYLDDIRAYNLEDCMSLYGLRDWLGELKNEIGSKPVKQSAVDPDADKDLSSKVPEELIRFERDLTTGLPESPLDDTPSQRLDRLIFNLADYYRREAKPAWWKLFSRETATTEELTEDGECIGGLTLSTTIPPYTEKRSTVYTFTFPDQEYKFRVGDRAHIAQDGAPAGDIVALNSEARTISIKRGKASGPFPPTFDLMPPGPIGTEPLKSTLWIFISSYIISRETGNHEYRAVMDLLERRRPRIRGVVEGESLYQSENAVIPAFIDIVKRMDETCLFIQGPPGTGKTYTAAHLIVGLMQTGKRVGVTANSHKVIHNLLRSIEQRAIEVGFTFEGVKKASWSADESSFTSQFITNVASNDEVHAQLGNVQLIAGTAWLFASFSGSVVLDYIFIDEAGQVSLANLIVVGCSAKNIVLIGDQMQLAQPTQGVHPGESGLSVLDYLLQGRHTIPPDEGILLETTYRMHPKISGFISDAVYDGRIRSLPTLENQSLLIPNDGNGFPASGIACHFISHDGCVQRSDEEAEHIQLLYSRLLEYRYRDKNGATFDFTPENILIVSPYNMQVNHLQRTLGSYARVGTVDKFQGQEAEVVIVSMATSNPEEIPRGMSFLYSQNRLNVSLSRAKILSILVMSPQLLSVQCNTIDQMKLANTLCWARNYAAGQQ